MVNEMNKPPSQENSALGERLLASQRQLQEMQEEHRQLIQEMEALRQRAAALSRLNEQKFIQEGDRERGTGTAANNTNENENSGGTESASLATVPQETFPNEITLEEQTNNSSASNEQTNELASQPTPNVDGDGEDEDPETAEYLQQKLADIAKLKARFKHVQNIMNTTDMIEQHIASKSESTTALENSLGKLNMTTDSEVQSPFVTSTTTNQSNITSQEGDVDIKTDPTKQESNTNSNDEQTLNTNVPSQAANEELLSAMMNMFSDFTADLRNQADDLRAERDRLRALKEDLLRRKRQL